jgi:hypothetical protein
MSRRLSSVIVVSAFRSLAPGSPAQLVVAANAIIIAAQELAIVRMILSSGGLGLRD